VVWFWTKKGKKKIKVIKQALNKTQLAKELGVSRSSLYYQPKRPAIDEEVRCQIESVLTEHPAYGHKRLALALGLNKKRILRVMKKFNLKPYRRKIRKPIKKEDQGRPPANYSNLVEKLIKEKQLNQPGQVWVSDFTYLRFHTRFLYLATVIDLFTREVVGWHLTRFHNRFLVIGALLQALEHYPPSLIIHSDQGTEYLSADFIDLANHYGLQISMSRKASPWENGYQESFFGHLKQEGADWSRFATLGELVEEVCRLVYYYNHQRIHSVLKMTPCQFREHYLKARKEEIKSLP
jgi:putative transposase